jgi:N-methylhydantoinase A
MLTFANDLGLSPDEAAEGILRVANATMERAIRIISVERGHDPRQFSLIVFGGAGPMHACDLARSLAIPTIVVPGNAGVLSAIGLLMADVVKDFSHTVLVAAGDISAGDMEALFAPLEEQARGVLEAEGFTSGHMNFQRLLDLRYAGQSYEVAVPAADDFREAFHAEHQRLYGHSDRSWPVELVNVRLSARGLVRSPELTPAELTGADSEHARIGTAQAVFGGERFETPVYERSGLRPGNRFRGPAVVVEMSATSVVGPDYEAEIDGFGNIIMIMEPQGISMSGRLGR